jgi:SAM-dependent methyltransferase
MGSTQRFSSRVENYVRYRPGYPPAVIELLKNECEITSDAVIADVASGTGIFTRILLENGNRVFGVEPNAEMRKAGEEFLVAYSHFTSVAGTAEATTLADHSIDVVTAAQAAHWFDRPKARHEFIRILKPRGWTVLLWNERRVDSTPFLREFEQLLLLARTIRASVTNAPRMKLRHFSDPLRSRSALLNICSIRLSCPRGTAVVFFLHTPIRRCGFTGPMLQELRRLFDENQMGGRVAFDYNTLVNYGQLA